MKRAPAHERYWLDEQDPRELRRRATDLAKDGHPALAQQLNQRADELDDRQ